jgi:hypothetical protein
MRKGSSDLLYNEWDHLCVVCVCVYFLLLLCFHVLDIKYLKTIIGNSFSPVARDWNQA